MQALKRKPNLESRREMELPDGTKIAVKNVLAREMMKLQSNNKLSDAEKGMNLLAAKLLVDEQPVVLDDLLDCFTDEELNQLTDFAFPDKEKNA